MINQFSLTVNLATDPKYQMNGENEFATFLGIQNLYRGNNKPSVALKVPVLLRSRVIGLARKYNLSKGDTVVLSGTIGYSEKVQKYSFEADQLSPVVKRSEASEPKNEAENPKPKAKKV